MQTCETLDFARRAPLKRKMEESASHHKFTFSQNAALSYALGHNFQTFRRTAAQKKM